MRVGHLESHFEGFAQDLSKNSNPRTSKFYSRDASQFLDYLSSRTGEISIPDVITGFFAVHPNYTAGTVNRKLSGILRFIEFTAKKQGLPKPELNYRALNQLIIPAESKPKVEVYQPQFNQILETVRNYPLKFNAEFYNARDITALSLIYHLGLKTVDLVALNISDHLNLFEKALQSKVRVNSSVSLPIEHINYPLAREEFLGREKIDEQALFLGKDKIRIHERTLRKALGAHFTRAGYPDLTQIDLRRRHLKKNKAQKIES